MSASNPPARGGGARAILSERRHDAASTSAWCRGRALAFISATSCEADPPRYSPPAALGIAAAARRLGPATSIRLANATRTTTRRRVLVRRCRADKLGRRNQSSDGGQGARVQARQQTSPAGGATNSSTDQVTSVEGRGCARARRRRPPLRRRRCARGRRRGPPVARARTPRRRRRRGGEARGNAWREGWPAARRTRRRDGKARTRALRSEDRRPRRWSRRARARWPSKRLRSSPSRSSI